jgi:DNA-binding PadR family transcriptional regulator
MAEPNTIYKMTVLSLLSKVDIPLSNLQIVQFFLDCEYTGYFTIQQVLADLQDAHLIQATTDDSQTLYEITPEGLQTLRLMRDKINPEIEEDLCNYLEEHDLEIQTDYALTANYDRSTGGGYVVNCKYTVAGTVMLDLCFHASSASQAKTICNNWKVRYEEVYMSLMDTLLR